MHLSAQKFPVLKRSTSMVSRSHDSEPSSLSSTTPRSARTVGAPIPISLANAADSIGMNTGPDIEDTNPSACACASNPPSNNTLFDISLKVYPRPKALQSLKYLYRVGYGPSSSHTLAPGRAAARLASKISDAGIALSDCLVIAELYGSLAATGKGHLTDYAIEQKLNGCGELIFDWRHGEKLPYHTNGMRFLVYPLAPPELHPRDAGIIRTHFAAERIQPLIEPYIAYSLGGGALRDESTRAATNKPVDQSIYEIFPFTSMNEVLEMCDEGGINLWQLVERYEGPIIWQHMETVWEAMCGAVKRGIATYGPLPELDGVLIPRKAASLYARAKRTHARGGNVQRTLSIMAYAYAVSEENACASGNVVTAPTCGAAGVVPGLLYYLQEDMDLPDRSIHEALAVAGLVGTIAKGNASISGAEAGCQAEIGVATSMAAAAATYLLGGTPKQCEAAAENALESCTGLDCSPVNGRVVIPCIGRNALYATRALDCATLSLASVGENFVSYDEALLSMKLSGLAMREEFRETSLSGIASVFSLDRGLKEKETRAKYTGEVVERYTDEEVHTLNYDNLMEKLRTSSSASSGSGSSDEGIGNVPYMMRRPDVCD